jgi:hypothetical protein
MRELSQEARLVKSGSAGQQAGPRGFGPEPKLIHSPGGDLLERIQHPAFDTTEYMFRALPEDSWFSPGTNTRRPIKFEFGAFTVPESQNFLVTDYEFVALRQSGVDPFDFVQAAPYRFSGFMGFDITVNGRRMSDLFYQLDPAPVQFQKQSFQSAFDRLAPTGNFNRSAANSFGSVAGEGTSLLPVRPNVQGSRRMPFTIIAEAGSKVSLSAVIFRRVTAPLAGLQASVAGYTIHQNAMIALLNRVRPR